MNTSAKGAAYEEAFRSEYGQKHNTHRHKVFWQPPKPRQHSTGFDSLSWKVLWDDEGEIIARSEPTLWEFKSGKMSCRQAVLLKITWDKIRPSFTTFTVVHKTKEREFCEH